MRVGNKGRGTRQGKKVHAIGKIQVMHLKFLNHLCEATNRKFKV